MILSETRGAWPSAGRVCSTSHEGRHGNMTTPWYRKTGQSGDRKYIVLKTRKLQLLQCMHKAAGNINRKRDNKLLAEVSNGSIIVHPDFSWNGADWYPDIDCVMEASLVHDALYQLIHKKQIRQSLRKCADQQLYCLVRKNNCPKHASVMYNALRGHHKCPYVGAIIGGTVGIVRGGRRQIQCK